MKYTYTCKKISLNDSVKAYAEKKIGKLEKFFKEEPEASVTFSVEKKNRCVAEITLRGANGTLFRAVCEDPDGDMRGAIDEACAKLTAAGAKRALKLNVGGAFHSPLMEPARVELEAAIAAAPFAKPVCPVYQNVDAKPHTDPAEIRANLIAQLTSPVRWTQIVQNMLADGATSFTELGPGSVLQGLIKKVDRSAVCESKQSL